MFDVFFNEMLRCSYLALRLRMYMCVLFCFTLDVL